jgi:PGF-CTERM protein
MKRFLALLAIIVLVLGTIGGAAALHEPASEVATQSDQYSISVEGSIDVPNRDLTVDGTDYEVTAIAQKEAGEQFDISIDAPSGQEYELLLYNREEKIEQTIDGSVTGSQTISHDPGQLDPSTYLIVVYRDGQIQKIHPLIIQGYSVDVSSPATVMKGETATVSLSLSQVDDRAASPSGVEAVIGNGDVEKRFEATMTDSGYEASIPTDDLAAGSYVLYGAALGQQETESGDKVAIGISSQQDLTVEAAETDTPSGGDDDSDDGGSYAPSDGSGGDNTNGSSDTPTTTPTATQTSTATKTPTATMTPTATPTTTPAGSDDPTATPTPTPTADDVTTPGTATPDDTVETPGTTTGGQPGFTVVGAITAVVGATLILRRRS